MSDEKPIDRRHFFREGLRGLFRKVGEVAGPVQRVLGELEKSGAARGGQASVPPATPATPVPAGAEKPEPPARPLGSPPVGLRILRPPGAKEDEADFVTTCSTCGNCVDACPVQCIRIEPGRAGGAPFIVASESPCVLCDGLLCMYNCPSGALTAVPIGLVDMGTARWLEGRCVRSHGTECTMCVDRCPIGGRAIELVDGKVVVHPDGCTGCGVCEHECPTTPKSIVVIPRAMRE